MPITLVRTPQITPPPNGESNANLLSNIAAIDSLNPKEKAALSVFCLAAELANGVNPITTYDPANLANNDVLAQDTNTVLGPIPMGDLDSASVVIDWENAMKVTALSADVDALRGSLRNLVQYDDATLRRMQIYLRYELGR